MQRFILKLPLDVSGACLCYVVICHRSKTRSCLSFVQCLTSVINRAVALFFYKVIVIGCNFKMFFVVSWMDDLILGDERFWVIILRGQEKTLGMLEGKDLCQWNGEREIFKLQKFITNIYVFLQKWSWNVRSEKKNLQHMMHCNIMERIV